MYNAIVDYTIYIHISNNIAQSPLVQYIQSFYFARSFSFYPFQHSAQSFSSPACINPFVLIHCACISPFSPGQGWATEAKVGVGEAGGEAPAIHASCQQGFSRAESSPPRVMDASADAPSPARDHHRWMGIPPTWGRSSEDLAASAWAQVHRSNPWAGRDPGRGKDRPRTRGGWDPGRPRPRRVRKKSDFLHIYIEETHSFVQIAQIIMLFLCNVLKVRKT